MNLECDNLIAKVNSKDEKAWCVFFDSYYRALCNHAFRILKDEMIVDDIVQEIFMKLWDGNAWFENKNALTAYLYRAVTNNSLKYLRNRNVEDERLKLWSEGEQGLSEEDFSSIVREEVLRKLRDLIEQLPKHRREIILLSMEGLSGDEIAEKCGVTIHTVKQQKYRAYKFIKEELGNQWIVFVILFL